MKIRIRSFISNSKASIATLSLSAGTAIAIISSFGQSAFAQSAPIPGMDNYQSNEQNLLYGNSGFGNVNPMDLIQRATLAPSRSVEEFSAESQQNLDDAATEFKRLREQMLLAPNSTSAPQQSQSN